MPEHDPKRDRELAQQRRLYPRRAEQAGNAVGRWLGSSEAKRLQRNRKVAGALSAVLSEAELEQVEPVSITKGTLTLAVSDNILLSELRNHRYGALIAALVERGTGVTRVQLRLQRR